MALTAPDGRPLTVYQGKLAIYLAWSQPFIYRLLKGLQPHVRQVVLCQRTENLDRFPMPHVERLSIRALFSAPHARRAAARLQEKHHGHVLHAHFGFSAVKLMVLKQMLRVPMVVTFGGKDLGVHASRPKTQEVYRVLFGLAEQLVAVSEDLRRRAIEIGCPPEKIATVHRGVDLNDFAFVDRSARGDGPVRLLMVSRLVAKKGHADAFAALASLPPDTPDWRLTVIGEGEEKKELVRQLRRAGLRQRVRFLGAVPIGTVRAQMEAADVLLHPSVTSETGDREGIPNVLIEGQARGLPVVATRHGGIPEVVAEGRSALLVPEHAPEALSAALARLLRSRDLRLEMGRAGRRLVEEEFALERQVERHLELYSSLAQAYPPDHPRFGRPVPADLPAMLEASRAESGVHGDLSLSEAFETAFVREDGAAEQPEPWWYSAFWRLKRYVPEGIKYPAKRAIFGLSRRLFQAGRGLRRRP